MTSATTSYPTQDHADLTGQTVVVMGGSEGIGLEAARRVRAAGANVVLTGGDRRRLEQAGIELHALSTAAFDATDPARLSWFFQDLPQAIDHVIVTSGGSYYARLADMDFAKVRRAFDEQLLLPIQIARDAAGKVRLGGTLLFMTCVTARRRGVGLSVAAMVSAALPVLTANLALELAPLRVNLIAARMVNSRLSESVLEDDLGSRRNQLDETLSMHRLVGPADVADLAVRVMSNAAITGTTYDVDDRQPIARG
jgi:NAD(P)-dependent dehydrogenase (short-subunit alcohol dehydrogenase family)